MDETTNFKLKKPASEDYYNVQDFNDNMDILDEKVKKALDKDIFNQLTVGTRESGVIGDNSTSIGQNNLVSGTFSVAEGYGNKAVASSSHAEGSFSLAAGSGAHSEGYYTQALGQYSHAENTNNIAATENTHVEGKSNLASFGTLYMITGYDNAAKKLTLDSVSGLAVGDKIDIQATDLKGFSAISINAIDTTTKTITLDTSLDITSSWKYCVKRSTVTAAPIHAEGSNNIAVGANSHVEGSSNVASGSSAHAEGSNSKATGVSSHAEGGSSSAEGSYSHSEGASTKAIGNYSHAEGDQSVATGITSHAEGNLTNAIGIGSHAEGIETNATGQTSHAEGWRTRSLGITSHAEGSESIVASDYGHAEGVWNLVSVGYVTNITSFDNEAKTITVADSSSVVVGSSIDIKRSDKLSLFNVLVTMKSGLVLTLSTTATIDSSWQYAINRGVYTGGFPAHAEGQNNLAGGLYSHAEGGSTVAGGNYSHAEGNLTVAWGSYSHSEGIATRAGANASHTEGDRTTANGISSHAGGTLSTASALNSFVHGSFLKANGNEQAVFGRCNEPNSTDLFQIGNGTSDSARKNALRVASDGALIPTAITGNLTLNGAYVVSAGAGNYYRVIAGTCHVHLEFDFLASAPTTNVLFMGLPKPVGGTINMVIPMWWGNSSIVYLHVSTADGFLYSGAPTPSSGRFAYNFSYPVV
ncbi:hypothetical protein R2R35_16635 [Anaerocolumna sp. AGMB13020]|uniref:hypothetical protein n=1 Tax=Anaerocolumna sp. AGMB13020 TaxID=3081750 RepID=UPI0029548F09|nr:hypothetical protein [Anaerocolumna sp. AGMB13020]WOO35415.1 hypothetical protein R2R35_16635 [Anaerocolumna sp. AGMB13020]